MIVLQNKKDEFNSQFKKEKQPQNQSYDFTLSF